MSKTVVIQNVSRSSTNIPPKAISNMLNKTAIPVQVSSQTELEQHKNKFGNIMNQFIPLSDDPNNIFENIYEYASYNLWELQTQTDFSKKEYSTNYMSWESPKTGSNLQYEKNPILEWCSYYDSQTKLVFLLLRRKLRPLIIEQYYDTINGAHAFAEAVWLFSDMKSKVFLEIDLKILRGLSFIKLVNF